MNTTAVNNVNTRLSLAVSEALEANGMGMRELADRLQVTYEHVRRIVRGECIPSRFVIKAICDELKLNFVEIERLATADKIQKKFGTLPTELTGKKPGLAPIELYWDGLTADQKNDVVRMVEAWYKGNKARR